MAKVRKDMSVLVAQAVAMQLEQNTTKQWGYIQHLAMLRYLMVLCSDKANASLDEIKKLDKIVVDYQKFKAECDASELAECANFKKTLIKAGDLPEKAPKVEIDLA